MILSCSGFISVMRSALYSEGAEFSISDFFFFSDGTRRHVKVI